jgi:hypothetical protein
MDAKHHCDRARFFTAASQQTDRSGSARMSASTAHADVA